MRRRSCFAETSYPPKMLKESGTPRDANELIRARLAAILESADEAMIAMDPEGVITDWNRSAENIFGFPASEMIGTNIARLAPPDRLEEVSLLLARAGKGEQIRRFETMRRRKDGRLLHVSASISPIRTADGTIVGISEIVRNTTAQMDDERKWVRWTRLDSALSQIKQAVTFPATGDEFSPRVCEALVLTAGLRAAWMHWTQNPSVAVHATMLQDGMEDLPAELRNHLDDDALATGEHFVCINPDQAASMQPWRAVLQERGIASIAVFPVHGGAGGRGSLIVASGEVEYFGEKETAILSEIANTVSLALAHFAEKEERRSAEQAVESERRFSSMMIESLPGILYFYDEDFRFLRWNQNFEKLSGYSAEEIARMTPLDFFPDGEKPLVAQRIREVFETGMSSVDANFLAKDGTSTPFHFTGRLVEYDGRSCLVGLGVEISARKLAEERHRESEGRYRTLFEYAPDGILIVDPEARIVDANTSVCHMLGFTRDELAGLHSRHIVDATELSQIDPALKDIHAKKDYHREWILRRKDSSTFPTDVIATMMPDGNILAMVRDISQRKRVEKELRWKTAFLEAQVDSALDGILVVNSDGQRILQNQRVIELWKIPPEVTASDDPRAQLYFAGNRTKDPEQFINRVFEITSNPDAVSRDEIELVDDTVLDRYSAPVRDASGTYYGRIWCFRDVTAERRREAELGKALTLEKELSEKARAGERAKGEFLAVMSHEVRTPLNGILGFSEILARTPGLPEDAREIAQTIVASGEALLHILDDVLDLSSLESAAASIQHASFAPREVLENTRLMLAPLATEKGLALDLSIAPDAPSLVMGDAARTRQILLNLTGNALKFTERGGVTLGFRRGDNPGWMEFFVSDTGPGIPPEQVSKIFQPFTQADSSHTRRHGGVGLGLAISQRLAELMRGHLTVTSRPGSGAEFRLSLPLEELASTEPAKSPAQEFALDTRFAVLHPLRLLVVEDDKVNLRLVTTLFRRLGYTPSAAANGREAVEACATTRMDCIFMDIQMPEMNGIEATRRIRDAERAAAGTDPAFIVALTANVVEADRRKCFEAGMDAYLNKPVNLSAIARVLVEASARRRLN
jgi:PAS domain S-box